MPLGKVTYSLNVQVECDIYFEWSRVQCSCTFAVVFPPVFIKEFDVCGMCIIQVLPSCTKHVQDWNATVSVGYLARDYMTEINHKAKSFEQFSQYFPIHIFPGC